MISIVEELKAYRNFAECILLEINWKNYMTTVELVFNYVWDKLGKIRHDVDCIQRVTLSCNLVQEIHFKGGLNPSMCSEPTQINWGINEVALVRLQEQEDFLHPYHALPVPFHHLSVTWEFDRRIDIIFSNLDIRAI